MLVDDNDTMYVAYGNTTINVAQLSADGRTQVRSQQVFNTPSSVGTLEGARFYKRNGAYYIWLTRPANGQYVLKANNPWGPYEMRQVLLDLPGAAEASQGELPINLRAAREVADRKAIRQALSRTDNNISGAAKLLGVSRPTLYDLLKQYRLQA